MDRSFSILNWNPRGLNARAQRLAVQSLVDQVCCSVLSLQETKLAAFPPEMLQEMVGPSLDGHAFLPVAGTRGGVLLAWNTSVFAADCIEVSTFAVTARLTPCSGGIPWFISPVYGPSEDARKPMFLHELIALRGHVSGPWLILGDFNLIYEARDKNNSNLDRPMMARFRAALNASELKEFKLAGRRFTWSNEQADPTLCHLDRAFCDMDWDCAFPSARL